MENKYGADDEKIMKRVYTATETIFEGADSDKPFSGKVTVINRRFRTLHLRLY